MSTTISDKISLDRVIPLVDLLSDVEREELRQLLAAKPPIDWQSEWDNVVSYFHTVFKKFPQDEVEADFNKT